MKPSQITRSISFPESFLNVHIDLLFWVCRSGVISFYRLSICTYLHFSPSALAPPQISIRYHSIRVQFVGLGCGSSSTKYWGITVLTWEPRRSFMTVRVRWKSSWWHAWLMMYCTVQYIQSITVPKVRDEKTMDHYGPAVCGMTSSPSESSVGVFLSGQVKKSKSLKISAPDWLQCTQSPVHLWTNSQFHQYCTYPTTWQGL